MPCFNSRSRVGSDLFSGNQASCVEVSIRAPAWGATLHRELVKAVPKVSIRAPAWGATAASAFQFALPRGERLIAFLVLLDTPLFQFALPRGERPAFQSFLLQLLAVSIRAPAWGATRRTAGTW